MEVDFQLVEHEAGQRAQTQRKDDLHNGFHDDADGVDAALFQRIGHAKRSREEHQTHRVVDGNDHQQQMGQRTVGLVLLDDHQGGCRSRCGGDGAQRDGRRHRDDVRAENMQDDQRGIDQRRGHDGL